ncbi:MAG: tRNA modification GTPase [Bacteroidia bacterium]|jgi:tRNA modification GTPase
MGTEASGRATQVRELTPRGRGGVTVLEITGPDAMRCLGTIAPGLDERSPSALAKAVLVRLAVETDEGTEDLDEALVWGRAADCLELHIHGSPVLAARVRELLFKAGAVGQADATQGFFQRAQLALESAPSEAAARMLLDQVGGAMARAIGELPAMDGGARRAALDAMIQAGTCGARLVNPPRVVLAGPVNAGKSTLFNLLVGAERVVVSGEEGTTRDAVRARVLLGAYAVDLVDTAGAREAMGEAAAVEQSGQAQGLAEAAVADLVLLLEPATESGLAQGGGGAELAMRTTGEVARLVTKLDQAPGHGQGLSCATDPAGAVATVEAAFHRALGLPSKPWRAGAPVPFDRLAMEFVLRLRDAVDEPNFGQLCERPA